MRRFDERSVRHSTSENDESVAHVLRDLVLNDRRLTGREVNEEVGISYGSCETILGENPSRPSSIHDC